MFCAFSWDKGQTAEARQGEKAAVTSKDITKMCRDILSVVSANTCLLSFRLRTAAPPKKIQCLLPVLRPCMPDLCSETCVQKSSQGNKNTEWQWGRCSWLRHTFQHQHLTGAKGEGAVGAGSALSTSADSCKEREGRSTEGVHFPHGSAMHSEHFPWGRLQQLAQSVPCALLSTAGAALLVLAALYFLDVTSTPSRNSMLKEFLCLISRFEMLFCTLLCSEPADTSCSSWAHTVCLSALPRGEGQWPGGWQRTRWCAGEHCCGKVTLQKPHSSRLVAELSLSHRCRTISAVWVVHVICLPLERVGLAAI